MPKNPLTHLCECVNLRPNYLPFLKGSVRVEYQNLIHLA